VEGFWDDCSDEELRRCKSRCEQNEGANALDNAFDS
jgi:hypothetical protein